MTTSPATSKTRSAGSTFSSQCCRYLPRGLISWESPKCSSHYASSRKPKDCKCSWRCSGSPLGSCLVFWWSRYFFWWYFRLCGSIFWSAIFGIFGWRLCNRMCRQSIGSIRIILNWSQNTTVLIMEECGCPTTITLTMCQMRCLPYSGCHSRAGLMKCTTPSKYKI